MSSSNKRPVVNLGKAWKATRLPPGLVGFLLMNSDGFATYYARAESVLARCQEEYRKPLEDEVKLVREFEILAPKFIES